MASHFLFHSEASETVPMEARYSFPTQASRVVKSVVKIPPRSGPDMTNLTSSSKGRLIQITLPAQGYLNPLESYLRFDLTIRAGTNTGVSGLRPVNNIHTMFRRLRVLYGSLVIEDIQNYGTLIRMLSNVAVDPLYQNKAGAILEGMGSDASRAILHNKFQAGGAGAGGSQGTLTAAVVTLNNSADSGVWGVGTGAASTNADATETHTYCLNLGAGLLTQQKLIPLKWLANQLTIELEIEEPAAFLVQGTTEAITSVTGIGFGADPIPRTYNQTAEALGTLSPSYDMQNIYFDAEILEFDSTYDAAFYQGMLQGGIPLKFASWHGHLHSLLNSSYQVLTIQERSRSIKSAFSVIRDRNDITASTLRSDPYWFYASTADMGPLGYRASAAAYLDEFQWRVGGRYFPSQPVKCTNGGAEPLIELQKALNVIGDYTTGSLIRPHNWWNSKGTFTLSAEFESSNGMEMSGVNAEELADLALVLKYGQGSAAGAQVGPTATSSLFTFIHYDALLIIRPNNVVELVQ